MDTEPNEVIGRVCKYMNIPVAPCASARARYLSPGLRDLVYLTWRSLNLREVPGNLAANSLLMDFQLRGSPFSSMTCSLSRMISKSSAGMNLMPIIMMGGMVEEINKVYV